MEKVSYTSSWDNVSIDTTVSVNETGSVISSFPITNNGLFRITYGSMKDSWALRDGKPTGAGFYRSRMAGRRVSRRLVHKNGECNVSHVNVPKQRRKYIRDIFTTLIDVKWRWSLLIFGAGFMLSWTIFAIIYYLICLAHNDFKHYQEEGFKPCIYNVPPNSFASIFLFSIESQHTIGYGHRYISDECAEAIFVLCLQSIVGVMIQSFMAGVVFVKLARPKKRAETLIFSKNAVIYMRDGQLCFLFRVGDMRTSHLVEAHIRLQMIKKKVTQEGEMLAFHQFDMDIGYDDGLDRIFLVWPLTICHIIDEGSPLYEYAAEDIANGRFEVVAILEGIVESTGMTTQARTSWLPSEILWGHRFEKLVTYQRDNGDYKIDYARFHNSYPVDTPRCSAKDLDEMRSQGIVVSSITADADNQSVGTTREGPHDDDDGDSSSSECPSKDALPAAQKKSCLIARGNRSSISSDNLTSLHRGLDPHATDALLTSKKSSGNHDSAIASSRDEESQSQQQDGDPIYRRLSRSLLSRTPSIISHGFDNYLTKHRRTYSTQTRCLNPRDPPTPVTSAAGHRAIWAHRKHNSFNLEKIAAQDSTDSLLRNAEYAPPSPAEDRSSSSAVANKPDAGTTVHLVDETDDPSGAFPISSSTSAQQSPAIPSPPTVIIRSPTMSTSSSLLSKLS